MNNELKQLLEQLIKNKEMGHNDNLIIELIAQKWKNRKIISTDDGKSFIIARQHTSNNEPYQQYTRSPTKLLLYLYHNNKKELLITILKDPNCKKTVFRNSKLGKLCIIKAV